MMQPALWMKERLPEALMVRGPLDLAYWQWIGAALAVVLAVTLASIVALGMRAVVHMVTQRTETEWDDLIVNRVRGPFIVWLTGMLFSPLVGMLDLPVRAGKWVSAGTRGVVLAALFWLAMRIISVVQDQLLNGRWAAEQVQARTLIPLLGRFVRVTLVVVAVLVVLSQFGYPVGSLLAGIGIGGVALALASQKTVEHLFGSVSLAADQAFRVGDFVRIGELEGTVERIGLRSTSVRTLKRTVVRIPNGRLADERIETFGERDRFLFDHDIGVEYSTTPDQLEALTAAIERTLRAEPTLWPDTVIVRVIRLADSGIVLRIRAWFEVPELAVFLEVQHRLLLAIMRDVKAAGTAFAFPSVSVYSVGDAVPGVEAAAAAVSSRLSHRPTP